jgi:hypothetical protein
MVSFTNRVVSILKVLMQLTSSLVTRRLEDRLYVGQLLANQVVNDNSLSSLIRTEGRFANCMVIF